MFRRTMTMVLLALGLLASACAQAESSQVEGPAAVALTPTTVAPGTSPDGQGSGASSEGIQVHGAWTISIRNPDGTETSRAEFNNEYSGGSILARILNGEGSVCTDQNDWWIILGEGAYNTRVDATSERRSTTLVISASHTAAQSMSLTRVGTALPYDIGAGCNETDFTQHSFHPDDYVTIEANQTAYFEVEISFS